MGSSSTIFNRRIWTSFTPNSISRWKFYTERYEGSAFTIFCFRFSVQFDFIVVLFPQIIHMGRNETIHKTEENKDIERLQGCFYRGRVRGDDHSVVTVSLCEGMVRNT